MADPDVESERQDPIFQQLQRIYDCLDPPKIRDAEIKHLLPKPPPLPVYDKLLAPHEGWLVIGHLGELRIRFVVGVGKRAGHRYHIMQSYRWKGLSGEPVYHRFDKVEPIRPDDRPRRPRRWRGPRREAPLASHSAPDDDV